MPASVAAVLQRLGRLDDGDVAIVNDPFAGGTHLPDITIISPVYHDKRVVGYAANRAHHADVGGTSPGSMTLSTHIDEEGICIEPALLYRSGRRDEAMLRRILDAVRTPDERLGDLDAQLAANHVGAGVLQKMVADHGTEHVQTYGRALLDYSQQFMSEVIRDIPVGQWSCQDMMDGGVRIAATLRITGDRAAVDLSGCDDQVSDCINCPRAVTCSAVWYCFGCLLEESVPLNGGCFRNVEVITRPGSVVHAEYPSAVVAGNTETSQRIVDVVLGALAQALPDRIPAASCGTMSSVALGGPGWTYYETIGGGCGAGPNWHGESGIQCHMTNTLNTPAEAIEMQYPLRVAALEVVANGGAGRFRGGGGIRRVIQALQPCTGTILSDRRTTRPHGLSGGSSGECGSNQLFRAADSIPLAGKCHFQLSPGDRLEILTPGGGGWGRAL
jgi:N-methylhydantoinase B